MKILVTGTAGFIGNHVALDRLRAGHEIVGLDIVNDYYDVALKEARLDRLRSFANFTEARIDLADADAIDESFARFKPEVVIHLAAQAGVRYSLTHPRAYVRGNMDGFLNVLEGCRATGVRHLLYASTSSVYGANTRQPFSEHAPANHPLTLYAASKRANELMAHSYAHLFGLPCTGLRFFTVYGPWGRPDMAPAKFVKGILAGEPIDIYNNGQMARDFTYIDDVVEGVTRLIDIVPTADPAWDSDAPDPATSGVAPWRLFNIGNSDVVPLLDFIDALESALGRKASRRFLPMQPGDVLSTKADISDLKAATDFRPKTPVEIGITKFADWYRRYYGHG